MITDTQTTFIFSLFSISKRTLVCLFLLVTMSGCGGTLSSQTGSISSIQQDNIPKKYSLSQEELKLDCGKLTGRTQIRIMASRGVDLKDAPSSASQALGFLTGTIFGTNATSNSTNQSSNDRLVLQAYNKRLEDMGCKSFDLEKELANRPSAPTPEPTILEKKVQIISEDQN